MSPSSNTNLKTVPGERFEFIQTEDEISLSMHGGKQETLLQMMTNKVNTHSIDLDSITAEDIASFTGTNTGTAPTALEKSIYISDALNRTRSATNYQPDPALPNKFHVRMTPNNNESSRATFIH